MKTWFAATMCALSLFPAQAQTHPAIERFLAARYMQGASVSIMAKDIGGDSVICSYDADREVTPASVIKTVTTAAALEMLGEDFRYETAVMYDGRIRDSILDGNLYICGSGDPTLGSIDMGPDRDKVLREWVEAVAKAGIRKVMGAVISDESVFDTEGISMKWLREDLGSYYGQGCYGLNIYDNRYSLYLDTGEAGSRPTIKRCDPETPGLLFRNYLTATNGAKDSFYIVGFPYSNERFLYGTVPGNRHDLRISGDIPDPALFLAQRLAKLLQERQIQVLGAPTCHRILSQEGKWKNEERKTLIATYSLPLKQLVRITNHTSNNLYADAFLKTIGLKSQTAGVVSSFDKGVELLRKHWNGKGMDTSSLWMFDGSGLAPTDKATASFLCDLLSYMATRSSASKAFVESIPRAGMEGTVRNMLKGSALEGKIRLKSGTMSRVCCYAGYVEKGNKQYSVAILVNNFSCKQGQMKKGIERLLSDLF